MTNWRCALALDASRRRTAGATGELAAALRRGADLRIFTTFNWRNHMGTAHPDQGQVEETIDLRVVYLIDNDWPAALTSLRYPADAGLGFGAQASLSFFMYNHTGEFGIARAYFTAADRPASIQRDFGSHYHMGDMHDSDTLSPSHNAVYDFEVYRWLVRDDWQEVLSHDEHGTVQSGSLQALAEAFGAGCSVKVAVRDLCRELLPPGQPLLTHEVLVELGSMYFHKEHGFHSGESLPLVRIAPAKPLKYSSANWDFGWVLPRTDGRLFHLKIDPYTREVTRTSALHAMRWFVR